MKEIPTSAAPEEDANPAVPSLITCKQIISTHCNTLISLHKVDRTTFQKGEGGKPGIESLKRLI